jgi:hypothetical protein
MNLTPLQIKVLERAREIITPVENWTRYVGARDKDGESISSRSDKACQWCLVGALGKASGELSPPGEDMLDKSSDRDNLYSALGHVSGRMFGKNPMAVNDREGHACALQLLDETIRVVKAHEVAA